MELLGSRTEQNLKTAFSGESEARNKYTYYAAAARKEGYEYIASVFEETAANEREHARLEFVALGGVKDTLANLANAALGEHYEWAEMYRSFADVARDEGFKDIETLFRNLASIEYAHEARFQTLIDDLNNGKIFKKEETQRWKCINCGYGFEGAEPPEICPTCKHPRAFFEPVAGGN